MRQVRSVQTPQLAEAEPREEGGGGQRETGQFKSLKFKVPAHRSNFNLPVLVMTCINATLTLVLLLCTATVAAAGETKGYYSWNWGSGSKGPGDVSAEDDRIGVAFTGLVDVGKAIEGYPHGATWCCPELQGSRFLSLGGGNAAGTFTVSALAGIKAGLADVKAANYVGFERSEG